MLSLRWGLVGLIVLATIGFVVGTSIERGEESGESAAHVAAERGTVESEEAHGDEGAEEEAGGEAVAASSESAEGPSGAEESEEWRPLGLDIESTPFIVLAALGSVGLAAMGWTRPRWLPGLGVVVVAMGLFAALDVREAFHQVDEDRAGLAFLAAVIAALHLAAAGVAAAMARRRGGPDPATS